MFDCTDGLCRAIPLLACRIGTIDFDQHGVIIVRSERSFNRFQISPVAVRRDLNASGETRCKIVGKSYRRLRATVTNAPRRNKLGIGVNRNPRPYIACVGSRRLCAGNVLLLGVNERPNFVELKPLALEIAERAILI